MIIICVLSSHSKGWTKLLDSRIFNHFRKIVYIYRLIACQATTMFYPTFCGPYIRQSLVPDLQQYVVYFPNLAPGSNNFSSPTTFRSPVVTKTFGKMPLNDRCAALRFDPCSQRRKYWRCQVFPSPHRSLAPWPSCLHERTSNSPPGY